MNPADQLNPFGQYDYLLVYHPEEHTATMELLAAVEKGYIEWTNITTTHTHTHTHCYRWRESFTANIH